MNIVLNIILLTVVFNIAYAQLPKVKAVTVSVASDGAVLSFREVEGAISYMGILTGHNVTVESTTPSLYFSDLKHFTDYEVLLTAIDVLNQPGIFEIINFKTGPGPVQNVRIVTISSSLLSVEWDEMEGVESYPLDFSEAPQVFIPTGNDTTDFKPVPTTINTGPTSRTFTNLEPMTHYIFRIRAQQGTSLGPEEIYTFRTDGTGIRYDSVWNNHNREMGASGKIYRSLDIPNGPYNIRIRFPCKVGKFEFWNAQLNEEASDPENGMYALVQIEQWELQKTEIGFNFEYYFNETNNKKSCFFQRTEIALEFGDDSLPSAQSGEITEKYDVNTTISLWGTGGIIYIDVGNVFLDPNRALDNTSNLLVKPMYGLTAFQVNMGRNCKKIKMQHCWNFQRVYEFSGLEETDTSYYFVQTEEDWHTNDIGIVFEYDRKVCPEPEDISVSALVGGDLVRALTLGYNLQEHEGLCEDLKIV